MADQWNESGMQDERSNGKINGMQDARSMKTSINENMQDITRINKTAKMSTLIATRCPTYGEVE